MNLAITNWMMELRTMSNYVLKAPSPMYSSMVSALGLWKVQLYCPVIAMEVEKCNNSTQGQDDPKLEFSLNYHQVEGVIQLNYEVMVREKWIDVLVSIDNVRYGRFPIFILEIVSNVNGITKINRYQIDICLNVIIDTFIRFKFIY